MQCWKLFTATPAVSRWIKSEGKLEAKIHYAGLKEGELAVERQERRAYEFKQGQENRKMAVPVLLYGLAGQPEEKV